MLRIALERGLSSLIAKWMLEGRADTVLTRVAKSGALPAEELEALRAQTTARLTQVRDDGAPYADMVTDAIGGLRASVPDFAAILRTADGSNARVVAAAVAEELARRASGLARAAAEQVPAGDVKRAVKSATEAAPAPEAASSPTAEPAP